MVVAFGDAGRHAGLENRRLDRARRGQGEVPGCGTARAGGGERVRAHQVRRRVRRRHGGVPSEPQRLAARRRGAVLQGRAAPRDDAAPRARVPGVADALVPRRRKRFVRGGAGAVAADVPKRARLGGEAVEAVKTAHVSAATRRRDGRNASK